MKQRIDSSRMLPAMARGALLGALPAPGVAIWAQLVNPWFLDAPLLYVLLVGLPGALLGAVFGLLLNRFLGKGALHNLCPLSLAVLLLLPAGLGFLWPRPEPRNDVKLLVFGVDGATFDVMKLMWQDLPTFKKVRDQGAIAVLNSMEPMFSPLLWTTISTGKPPEEHGVHGFHVQASDCQAARFWEIMMDAGVRLGVYKWLVTYPPQDMGEGFLVPGWLAPEAQTWPSDLSFIKELELSRRLKRHKVASRRSNLALLVDGVRHGLRFSTVLYAVRVTLQEKILSPDPNRSNANGQFIRVQMDRDVFVWALHEFKPQVVTFTDYATDAIGHRFWKYYEPGAFSDVTAADAKRWGDTLRQAYRQADSVLGELLDEVGRQANLVVVSDHGFQAVETDGAGRFFAPLTEKLKALVEANTGPAEVTRLGHKVVVTLLGENPDLKRLVVFLRTLRLSSTGEPLYKWEPMVGDVRSLGLTIRDEWVSEDRIRQDTVSGLPLSDFIKPTEVYSGVHAPDGVFMAAGPSIPSGGTLDDLNLVDVAPTLLALLGLPQASDMEGTVPDEILDRLPVLPQGPDSYDHLALGRRLDKGAAGVNEEQLRALGYME